MSVGGMSDEVIPEEDVPPWWWHTEHKRGCKAWKLDAGSRDCTCGVR
jgi:hypothetical protein